ncbi:MAG: chromosome partitioning protein ParB [Chromatiales bacterium]|jgi:ParB family chromosome partitioning protein|nr:chromosome partitioning protein ParB [Chromatiales bacterium]MDP6150193.1 ParB/RepB/Spo0J family partition protein [Gammaproteobacteria bacterium]MDP7094100.1 ParB/RepB/Spo0J family partition protein [Gammaproteobacteria bacterium]HJP05414.1 ParB/RepB/Spo0J family partition protein [Gammaproteobacteria bacterium]
MAAKKTGLGKGLDALLGPVDMPPASPGDDIQPGLTTLSAPVPAPGKPATGLRNLALDLMMPGAFQPRRDMHKETLEELAESIKVQGVLAPISVRPLGPGGTGPTHYEIIAGERRWRAAQMAGLDSIPVVVRDVDDEAAAAIALIENLQREDLNPLEEAQGLKRLIEEFELTHQEAARAVGKSRAAVSNLIRLLDLEPKVREFLAGGELDMGHARALLALPGGRSQVEVARKVVARGLSVRETESLVRRLQARAQAGASTAKPSIDPDIRRLQDELRDKLGAKVAIQHTAKGKGKLIISYNSVDELDGILDHLK